MVSGASKKQIARRLGVNVKTVRRALNRSEAPARRVSPRRARGLDRYREQIVGRLKQEPKVTAKRIRRLLLPVAGPVPGRTVRKYVAQVRDELFPPLLERKRRAVGEATAIRQWELPEAIDSVVFSQGGVG